MVGHLHQQLKPALTARTDHDHWATHLPAMMQGLRTAFKQDLECAAVELAFGTTLCLPGDVLSHPDPTSMLIPSEHVQGLQDFFTKICPAIPCTHGSKADFASPALQNCTLIFLCRGTLKLVLIPTYTGLFAVLEHTKSMATIQLPERQDVVSLDWLKPAFLEASLCSFPPVIYLHLLYPLPHSHIPTSLYRRVSWVTHLTLSHNTETSLRRGPCSCRPLSCIIKCSPP